MKKLLLSAALLSGMILSANAQDGEAAASSGYKQEAGDKNVEVQFAPLGGNPVSIGGIRFRSFTSATSAMRANVFIGFSNETDITQQEDSDNDIKELKDKESSFTIAIAPGIEKHFAGTERFSPYVGAELPLEWNTTSSVSESQVGDDIIEGKTKDGYFQFGLNGVIGADFYFTKKMYLGTELGFGFQYRAIGKTVNSSTAEGAEDVETKNGSTFNLAPNVNTQIRLGFLF